MGISRDKWHKRCKTGGRMSQVHKKRKHESGRPAANTKLGARRIHTIRTRGGNKKYRALRIDAGNFSWGSEAISRKTRILDVVYNASNNELVRTKTLVKNCIVVIDSTAHRAWYEAHYATPLGRKKGVKLSPEEDAKINKKRSRKAKKKYNARKKTAKLEPLLEEQFATGRLLGRVAGSRMMMNSVTEEESSSAVLAPCISSRPGQCGRCDGYILEGKELEFYQRKIKAKKGK